jgi:tetratricopeptide (TPR) repeat protein
LAQAQPDAPGVADEVMLGRVLEGVLDAPVEPLKAGRYVLLEAVGRGGVGEVYAAFDPELDRRVAIKLVRAEAQGWGDLGPRMQREAQAMARVRHPNVVAIHDVGRFRDQVFIAMELLQGMTLSAWLRAQPRDWPALRDVFAQAGRGLAAIHDAGLVLRDFKPANVFVGDDGVVKVLDFGLARAAAASVPGADARKDGGSLLDQDLTRGGTIAGTPAYMAPEQIRGGSVDAAADQFAYCVALYEALWNERPFPGTDLVARYQAIEDQGLRPPPSAPPAVRAAILRGLALRPEDRHPSMRALVDALEVTKRRRMKTWVAIGAAALLSAAGTAAWFTMRKDEVTAQMLARVDALEEEARAAADANHYVYPPLEAPDAPTAYSRTLALEHIEGPASEPAQARAAALREEFSGRLTALGDAYAEKDGGAPFAADFYAAAVLFDADNEHARARSLLTASQLAALRARVEQGAFEEAELVVGASLAALAEEEPVARRTKVARLRSQRPNAPASTMASLEALVGPGAAETAPAPRPAVASATPTPEPAPKDVPLAPASDVPEPTRAGNRAEATALAKEGLRALRARELKQAETLLNRAIAKDRRNATALGGLAKYHFEMGRYSQAAKFAEKAVAAAPRSGKHRMTLGDAYFKVLRFQDAKAAYREAKRLGAPGAEKKLARVEAKLGG